MILWLTIALAGSTFDLGELKRRDRKQLEAIEAVWHRPAEGEERLADLLAVLADLEELAGPDHPELARVHGAIGAQLLDLERPNKAVPFLERAAALGGTVRSHRIRAARAIGDHATAEALVREQIAESPPDAAATWRVTLGSILHESGQTDAALETWREALAAREAAGLPDDPTVTVALLSLGDDARSSDPRLARGIYERITSADPKRAASAWIRIGELYLDRDDPVASVTYFERARTAARTEDQKRDALEHLIEAYEAGDIGGVDTLRDALQSPAAD